MKKTLSVLSAWLSLFLVSSLLFGEEMTDFPRLSNSDFSDFDVSSHLPAHWKGDDLTRCDPVENGVLVTLIREQSNHSSLNQMIPLKNKPIELVLTGKIHSITPRAGYFQVKFFKNKKELRRLSSESNGNRPTSVRLRFSTDEADAILIQCRVSTDRGVGTAVKFTDLKLEPAPEGLTSDWLMTSGNGEISLNGETFESGFQALLIRSDAERFAPVGKDIQISQNIRLPQTSKSNSEPNADSKPNTNSPSNTNFPSDSDSLIEFSAWLDADFIQFGWLKVELFREGKLIGEFKSPRNRWCQDLCRVTFPRNGADRATVHFVFDGRQKFHGERVRLHGIYFGPKRYQLPKVQPPAPTLEVVPGFETASLYLRHCMAVPSLESGKPQSSLTASLRFRKISDETAPDAKNSDETAPVAKNSENQAWEEAFPPIYFPEECSLRGSLVMLEEGTEYAFALTVKETVKESGDETSQTQTYRGTFRTKSSKVKVQKTIELGPENCHFPFEPLENGSAEKGWIRYTARPGFVLDAGEAAEVAIRLQDAQFIILEGLTIRGGAIHGIQMDQCNNIRILNCDISEFSRIGTQRPDLDGKFYLPDDSRHALNNDCGIRILSCDSILVERCWIHDPRGTANSWFYSHPAGPNAIFVGDSTGICIRWNDFIGSDLHRWNDTIEGAFNGSNHGSVYRDAEISGNYLAFGNDDGMELDGGQINCRFFFNRTEGHLCGVSTAPCKRGPCYLYQNLFCNPGDVFGLVGVGFKNNYQNIGTGPTFFFSNTILGYSNVFSSPGGSREEYESLADLQPFKAMARNNLAQNGSTISANFFQNLRSDFDWNLYSPSCYDELEKLRKQYPDASVETHGQCAEVAFQNAADGDFRLSETSPGRGAGISVPNFMSIDSPDVGALVSGSKITAIPWRPAPFYTDVMHVDLYWGHDENEHSQERLESQRDVPIAVGKMEVQNETTENLNEIKTKSKNKTDFRIVTVTATETLTKPVSFQVVQPDGASFFEVTPTSGVLRAGKSIQLTVKIRPQGITQARRNCSAFTIRSAEGLSRPVSVTVDSRSNAQLAQKDREGAIFGAIRSLEKGAVELEFDVPRNGEYWLFALGRKEECQWRSVTLDEGETLERIPLGPRLSGEFWLNVASNVFGGNANVPFHLTAGKHHFRLTPKTSKPLKLSRAAICENPDAFRLNPQK